MSPQNAIKQFCRHRLKFSRNFSYFWSDLMKSLSIWHAHIMHEKKRKLFKLRKTAFSSNIHIKKIFVQLFLYSVGDWRKKSSRVVESFSFHRHLKRLKKISNLIVSQQQLWQLWAIKIYDSWEIVIHESLWPTHGKCHQSIKCRDSKLKSLEIVGSSKAPELQS